MVALLGPEEVGCGNYGGNYDGFITTRQRQMLHRGAKVGGWMKWNGMVSQCGELYYSVPIMVVHDECD